MPLPLQWTPKNQVRAFKNNVQMRSNNNTHPGMRVPTFKPLQPCQTAHTNPLLYKYTLCHWQGSTPSTTAPASADTRHGCSLLLGPVNC